MENQQVTCVALSHRTSLAKISIFVFVLFVILAVKPCWKFVPITVIPPVTSFPYVNAGLILVMPPESEEDVVSTGFGDACMENSLV